MNDTWKKNFVYKKLCLSISLRTSQCKLNENQK